MDAMPRTLGEIMGRDLAEYKLVEASYLELTHGLMGFFPALVRDTEEMVICVDRELLLKVLEKLPKRRSQVGEMQMLVNISGEFGFPTGHPDGKNTRPLRILTWEEYKQRIREEENPFKWAAGLIGEDMSREEFRETLEAAREQGR